jgi:hypothetical protein
MLPGGLGSAPPAGPLPSGSSAQSHYERPSTKGGPYKERVVVFVHGIFGDADGTWRYSPSVYWPRLLLTDEAFQGSDLYVAAYSSPYLGNTMNVDEVVTNLNNRLISDEVFTKHREVVFVCHSLGGIVVQRLLLTFREYARQVPFIYFFSTPETGAQIANLGAVFSSDPLLKAVFPGDENDYLLTLENDWKAAQFHIHRLCAYEKKKYKGVLVVDRLSGTRNCDDPPLAINEDHLGIVKPDGVEHDSYVALRNAIKRYPIANAKPTAKVVANPSNAVQFLEAVIVGSATGELEEFQPTGTVALNIDLINNGPPSITKNWTMAVKLRNGEIFQGKETLSWITAYAQGDDKNPWKEFHSSDFIDQKTAITPVPIGGRVRGVIAFAFFGIPREKINEQDTEIILTFEDSRSRKSTTRYVIPTKVDLLVKPESEKDPKEQRLMAERDDVWNRLRSFLTVGPSDDLSSTRFSVVNDGGSDIASHTLSCHINSLNYFRNSVYFKNGRLEPRRFDKGPLRRSGDGESVECLKIVNTTSLGPADCADVTIVVDYTLMDQPQVQQEKRFRFATSKTPTGHSWDIQPLSAPIDYCNSSTLP